MISLVFGLFGLIVGSFLNVVILRFGERPISGRSACPHCKKQLAWFDMVPVLSWLVLSGRCRSCKATISIQYPMVEAATGILFAMIGAADLPLLATAVALCILAVLVCVFVYDLKHTIIPDLWVWTFCALSISLSLILSTSETSLWLTLLAGPAASLPLFALWGVSKGTWMGFGDVKLALGMGWLLGYPLGIIAVFLAFIIGAVISVPLLLWGKLLPEGSLGLTMKSEVPFGPFLIASCLLIWFALLYNVPIPFLI